MEPPQDWIPIITNAIKDENEDDRKLIISFINSNPLLFAQKMISIVLNPTVDPNIVHFASILHSRAFNTEPSHLCLLQKLFSENPDLKTNFTNSMKKLVCHPLDSVKREFSHTFVILILKIFTDPIISRIQFLFNFILELFNTSDSNTQSACLFILSEFLTYPEVSKASNDNLDRNQIHQIYTTLVHVLATPDTSSSMILPIIRTNSAKSISYFISSMPSFFNSESDIMATLSSLEVSFPISDEACFIQLFSILFQLIKSYYDISNLFFPVIKTYLVKSLSCQENFLIHVFQFITDLSNYESNLISNNFSIDDMKEQQSNIENGPKIQVPEPIKCHELIRSIAPQLLSYSFSMMLSFDPNDTDVEDPASFLQLSMYASCAFFDICDASPNEALIFFRNSIFNIFEKQNVPWTTVHAATMSLKGLCGSTFIRYHSIPTLMSEYKSCYTSNPICNEIIFCTRQIYNLIISNVKIPRLHESLLYIFHQLLKTFPWLICSINEETRDFYIPIDKILSEVIQFKIENIPPVAILLRYAQILEAISSSFNLEKWDFKPKGIEILFGSRERFMERCLSLLQLPSLNDPTQQNLMLAVGSAICNFFNAVSFNNSVEIVSFAGNVFTYFTELMRTNDDFDFHFRAAKYGVYEYVIGTIVSSFSQVKLPCNVEEGFRMVFELAVRKAQIDEDIAFAIACFLEYTRLKPLPLEVAEKIFQMGLNAIETRSSSLVKISCCMLNIFFQKVGLKGYPPLLNSAKNVIKILVEVLKDIICNNLSILSICPSIISLIGNIIIAICSAPDDVDVSEILNSVKDDCVNVILVFTEWKIEQTDEEIDFAENLYKSLAVLYTGFAKAYCKPTGDMEEKENLLQMVNYLKVFQKNVGFHSLSNETALNIITMIEAFAQRTSRIHNLILQRTKTSLRTFSEKAYNYPSYVAEKAKDLINYLKNV